jgi:BirA family biotin operon repressor/biotin-[acetyl-CoA-carboxylase] ligase
MKYEILKILRNQSEPVSGERLSRVLAVSRVSVWKHVKKLQECGYRIDASPKGYRLTAEPDIPYPWEFPDRQDSFHYFDEITSTMDTARDFARKGAEHMTVVAAGRQSAGRGRLRRFWHSDEGGLYITVILRPDIPPLLSFRVTFAAGIALVNVIRRLYNINACLKWPNDILVSGKKLSGMLSELEAEFDSVTFINLGIGINVNNSPEKVGLPAISLKTLLDQDVSRTVLLSRFLDTFENMFDILDKPVLLETWRSLSGTIGKEVKISVRNETVFGKAVDIDDTGALLVLTPNGEVKRIIYGDCWHHDPEK